MDLTALMPAFWGRRQARWLVGLACISGQQSSDYSLVPGTRDVKPIGPLVSYRHTTPSPARSRLSLNSIVKPIVDFDGDPTAIIDHGLDDNSLARLKADQA